MSLTESAGPLVGQLVFPDESEIVSRGVKASTALVVGDPVTFDTNGFALKADETSTQADGIGVVVHEDADNSSGSDGDVLVQIALGNTYVYFKMGGAVKPFSAIKLAADGDAIAHTHPATPVLNAIFSDTEVEAAIDITTEYLGFFFGRYYGHAKEEKDATAAVDADIGTVRLGI